MENNQYKNGKKQPMFLQSLQCTIKCELTELLAQYFLNDIVRNVYYAQ